MTNTFTLDTLRSETKRKFAPIIVELDEDTTVELPSLLRLGKKDRDAVIEVLEDIKSLNDSEGEDDPTDEDNELLIDSLSTILLRITPRAKKLIRAIEDDDAEVKLAILTTIISRWVASTQLGEADSSLT